MARTATKKPAPAPVEPEIDLSHLLDKDPSPVNRAEAEFLLECTGLDVSDLTPEEIFTRAVQFVAGSGHRAWQKSETAQDLHAELAERTAAAKAEAAEKRAARAAADPDDDEKPKRGRPRKAAAVEDEDEEEAVKPPRRGRPRKASPVVEDIEDEDEPPAKPARRARPARKPASSESPF